MTMRALEGSVLALLCEQIMAETNELAGGFKIFVSFYFISRRCDASHSALKELLQSSGSSRTRIHKVIKGNVTLCKFA